MPVHPLLWKSEFKLRHYFSPSKQPLLLSQYLFISDTTGTGTGLVTVSKEPGHLISWEGFSCPSERGCTCSFPFQWRPASSSASQCPAHQYVDFEARVRHSGMPGESSEIFLKQTLTPFWSETNINYKRMRTLLLNWGQPGIYKLYSINSWPGGLQVYRGKLKFKQDFFLLLPKIFPEQWFVWNELDGFSIGYSIPRQMPIFNLHETRHFNFLPELFLA